MAFEIPAHLRKDAGAHPSGAPAAPASGSDHVQKLLAPLLSEDWVKLSAREVGAHRTRIELDAHNTKTAVLKLISGNYDAVSAQLNGSLDSQQRAEELKSKLAALGSQVDGGDQSLIPPLVGALRTHSGLSHRLLLAQHQLSLTQLLQTYRSTFAPLVASPPPPLLESVRIWLDCTALLNRPEWEWSSSTDSGGLRALKADLVERLRVVRDRVEEELGRAWDAIPPEGLTSAQLVDALRLLGTLHARTQTLVGHLLNDILRPLLAETPADSAVSYAQSTSTDGDLALFHLAKGSVPATPQQAWHTAPILLPALEGLLSFLSTALPSLPSSSDASTPSQDLSALLIPSLIPLLVTQHLTPSLRAISDPSFLPAFASTASSFAAWESSSTSGRSAELATFAGRVGAAWARQRRADVLARAREIVGGAVEGQERDDSWLSRGEKDGWEGWVWERERVVLPEVAPAVEEKQATEEAAAPSSAEIALLPEPEETDDWAFDDPPSPAEAQPVAPSPVVAPPEAPAADDEEDAWGFDNDLSPPPPPPPPHVLAPQEDDEPDAWGFSGSDDDKPIVLSKAQPRQAKRLGKAKSKTASVDVGNQQQPMSPSGSVLSSTALFADGSETSSATASRTSSPAPVVKKGAMKLGKKASEAVPPPAPATREPEPEIEVETPPEPVQSGPRIVVERLRVSQRVKPLLELAQEVLQEVEELRKLSIDRVAPDSTSSAPSSVLQKAISDIFALFRALLPVAHQYTIAAGPAVAMQAVNDCEWLADEAQALFAHEEGVADCLRSAGGRWFDEELARRQTGAHSILDGAYSFVDSGDEQRGSDCESAVTDVVARLEELSLSWKPVLPLDRAFVALGAVLNSVLARILKEITDLDDITTAESQRLNEILKIMHPVEELFVEQPGAPSVVVGYVPLWLKFCYLSELLEASMADITYLFESGALIDFAPDELARLVRALFSDNTLRAKTIDKIMAGHPAV